MKTSYAIQIIKNIANENISDNEKALAIYEVMNMPTRMSITKAELVNALIWLWHQAYHFEKVEKGGADNG